MKVRFCDPNTKEPLKLTEDGREWQSEAGAAFRVVDGIPVFSGELYAENFGEQWTDFREVQIDSSGADNISKDRLAQTLGFDLPNLEGRVVLEVGSGAGRFTEILLEHGAHVYTTDPTKAIFANRKNNKANGDCVFFQSSIYGLPFDQHQFDIVLCIGVLQHLPDLKKGIVCLAENVKRDGGSLIVDCYHWRPYTRLAPRYLIGRPITSRLSVKTNRTIAKAYVSSWWWAAPLMKSSYLRSIATLFSPIAPLYFYGDLYQNASPNRLRELAVLDTNDFISARYDSGLSKRRLRQLIQETNPKDLVIETNRDLMLKHGKKRTAGLVARALY